MQNWAHFAKIGMRTPDCVRHAQTVVGCSCTWRTQLEFVRHFRENGPDHNTCDTHVMHNTHNDKVSDRCRLDYSLESFHRVRVDVADVRVAYVQNGGYLVSLAVGQD